MKQKSWLATIAIAGSASFSHARFGPPGPPPGMVIQHECYAPEGHPTDMMCPTIEDAEFYCRRFNDHDEVFYEHDENTKESLVHYVSCEDVTQITRMNAADPHSLELEKKFQAQFKVPGKKSIWMKARINNKYVIPMKLGNGTASDAEDGLIYRGENSPYKDMLDEVDRQAKRMAISTCFKFVHNDGFYATDDSNVLNIVDYGEEGVCLGGGKSIYMNPGCGFAFTHEIGHCMGYPHEQQMGGLKGRYVNIDYQLISREKFSNKWYRNQKDKGTLKAGQYEHDIFSMMHYGYKSKGEPYVYWRNGKPLDKFDVNTFYTDWMLNTVNDTKNAFSRVDHLEWNHQNNCHQLDIPMKQAIQIFNKADPTKFTVVQFENDGFIFDYLNLGNLPDMSEFLNQKPVQLIFPANELGGEFNIRLEYQDEETGEYFRKCVNYKNELVDCIAFTGYTDNDEYLFNMAPYSDSASNNLIRFDNASPIDLSDLDQVSANVISQSNLETRDQIYYYDGYWKSTSEDVNYLVPGHLCDFNNGLCSEYCRNDDNGLTRSCLCAEGFVLAEDGVSCQDINECQDEEANVCGHFTPGSSSKCYNFIGDTYGYHLEGGFSCFCDFGWTYDQTTKSCLRDEIYQQETTDLYGLTNSVFGCARYTADGQSFLFDKDCDSVYEEEPEIGALIGPEQAIFKLNQYGQIIDKWGRCATIAVDGGIANKNECENKKGPHEVRWVKCRASNKKQIFRQERIGDHIRFVNSGCENVDIGTGIVKSCLTAHKRWDKVVRFEFSVCEDIAEDGTVPNKYKQLFDLTTVEYVAPDVNNMVANFSSSYIDTEIHSSDINNFCNVPWGRILQGPNLYELICVDHHTGKISYYNYQTGTLTVNRQNNRGCIGNYYDISVFVSNHWGVRCVNADNRRDEFGLDWCRHGQLTGYPGASLIQGDWDNDGIQDLMCFGYDGVIKMAYGTSDGRLVKDPTPRYYQHFTDWLAIQVHNTTSGDGNDYVHDHFKLYARDNNDDGLLDIIAYSTAHTGNIYQMNAVPNLNSVSTYYNDLNNQTMVACPISDSVMDKNGKSCVSKLALPVNKIGSHCARTAGKCNYDQVDVRGPYFNTNPFEAVQYLDIQEVTPFGQGFCHETWATLLQLDLTPLHGEKFDWYCFNYKEGTLTNFYTGEVIFENFCKSIYERNESEFVEMDAQASGQLVVEHNDNGSVDILCIARRDNTAFYFDSLPITFQPANSEVVQSDLCLNSACEYCNPVTGDCGCPENWQLNADGNTCNKVCSETQQLAADGNSCVIKDYCAAHPEDCVISDTFVDALTKFDVTIACHNHPDQVLSGTVNRKLEWWQKAATFPRETPTNDLSKIRLIQEGDYYRLGYAGNKNKWTYWLSGDSNSYMTRTDISLEMNRIHKDFDRGFFKLKKVGNAFQLIAKDTVNYELGYFYLECIPAVSTPGDVKFPDFRLKFKAHDANIPYDYSNTLFNIQLECPFNMRLSDDHQTCVYKPEYDLDRNLLQSWTENPIYISNSAGDRIAIPDNQDIKKRYHLEMEAPVINSFNQKLILSSTSEFEGELSYTPKFYNTEMYFNLHINGNDGNYGPGLAVDTWHQHDNHLNKIFVIKQEGELYKFVNKGDFRFAITVCSENGTLSMELDEFGNQNQLFNIEFAPEKECRVWQTLAEDGLTCVTNSANLMPEGMLEQMQNHRFTVSTKANPDLRLAYDGDIKFNNQFSLMDVSEIPEGNDQFLLDTGSDEDHFAISLAKSTWWGMYLKQTRNTRLRSYVDQFNTQKNQISADRSFGFKRIGDYFLLHASTNSDYVAEMTPDNFYVSGYAKISDASLFKINLICDYPMILRSDGFACIYDPELRVEQAVFDSLMNQPVRIESLVNNYRLGLRDDLNFNNNAALSISPHVLNAMGQKLKMVPLETTHNFYCDRCFHLTFYDFTTRNFDISGGYKSDNKVHLYNAHTGGNQVFRLIKQGENYKILAAANLDFAMTVDLANFDRLSINDNHRETMEADQTFKISVLKPEARECPAWMVSINDGTACADNPEYDLPATLLSEMQRNNFYLTPKVDGDNQVIQISKTGWSTPVQVVETNSENANPAHQIFKADAGTQECLIRMSIAASSFWGLRLATSDRINNFDALEVHKSVNHQRNDILIKKVGDAFILVSAENPDYVVNFTAEKAYLTAYPEINDASLVNIKLICRYPEIVSEDGFACINDPELRIAQEQIDAWVGQTLFIESVANNLRFGIADHQTVAKHREFSYFDPLLNSAGQRFMLQPIAVDSDNYCDRCFNLVMASDNNLAVLISQGYKDNSRVKSHSLSQNLNQVWMLVQENNHVKLVARGNTEFALTVKTENLDISQLMARADNEVSQQFRLSIAPELECAVWQTLSAETGLCESNPDYEMPAGMLHDMSAHGFSLESNAVENQVIGSDKMDWWQRLKLQDQQDPPTDLQSWKIHSNGDDTFQFRFKTAGWTFDTNHNKHWNNRDPIYVYNKSPSPNKNYKFKQVSADGFVMVHSLNEQMALACLPTADQCWWSNYRGLNEFNVFRIVLQCPDHLKKTFSGYNCVSPDDYG